MEKYPIDIAPFAQHQTRGQTQRQVISKAAIYIGIDPAPPPIPQADPQAALAHVIQTRRRIKSAQISLEQSLIPLQSYKRKNKFILELVSRSQSFPSLRRGQTLILRQVIIIQRHPNQRRVMILYMVTKILWLQLQFIRCP